MKIWVDADACPVDMKAIIFKAAIRTSTHTCLVANHPMQIPKSPFLRLMQVPSGFDVADHEIIKNLEAGDLVITADIPLASEAMDHGAQVINPRGETYSKETIRSKLNIRDFMDTMRSSGVQSGGPPPLNQKNKQDFANSLDSILAKAKRR